jgi:putative transposase
MTRDSTVIRRPIKKKKQQNLCLDKDTILQKIEHKVVKRSYIPHIRRRGEKKKKYREKKRRGQWFVENINSWHNRFRKLFIRYEKKSENYRGSVQLVA